jgi:hypothetical protein
MRASGRVIGFALATVVFGGGLVWESTHPESVTNSRDSLVRRAASALAPRGASGAVWFCPLAASTTDSTGASLRISSSGASAVAAAEASTLRVSLHGPGGEMISTPYKLGTQALVIPIADLVGQIPGVDIRTLPSLAATVESINDPSILVEATLGNRSAGYVTCATSVSPQWYLAEGSTALNTSTELALFNPFPGPALVDLQFWTDRGGARPTALQGVAVPGGAIRVIDLGDFVRRRDRIATEVKVRSGRVVVAENRTSKNQSELVVATPELAPTWFVPSAIWTEQRPELFTIVNPGDKDATVEIAATFSPADVEPFELIIPAGSSQVFDPQAEEGRIPAKTAYALIFNVKTGPEIVVGHSVPGRGSRLPDARHASYQAVPFTSDRWVVPNVVNVTIRIFNPYEIPATVKVMAGKTAVVPAFTVPAGGLKSLTELPVDESVSAYTVSAAGAEIVVSQTTSGPANTQTISIAVGG